MSDYATLCGQPKIRKIWHPTLHCYVEVACTDVGRAYQPTPKGDHDDLITSTPEDRALFVTRKPQSDVAGNHRRVTEYLRQYNDYVLVDDVAADLEIPKRNMTYLLRRFGDQYETKLMTSFFRPTGGGKGNPISKLAIRLKDYS